MPFKDVDNDKLLSIIRRYSRLFFVEILGFSWMSNHCLVRTRYFTDSGVIGSKTFVADALFEVF